MKIRLKTDTYIYYVVKGAVVVIKSFPENFIFQIFTDLHVISGKIIIKLKLGYVVTSSSFLLVYFTFKIE